MGSKPFKTKKTTSKHYKLKKHLKKAYTQIGHILTLIYKNKPIFLSDLSHLEDRDDLKEKEDKQGVNKK